MDLTEDILLERSPAIAFDVVMESPLFVTMERKVGNKSDSSGDKMNSSMNSTLEDTTPSDSGVQLLDSESSELMVESFTSQSGFELEDFKTSDKTNIQSIQTQFQSQIKELHPVKVEQVQVPEHPVDTNSNEMPSCDDDVMTASALSTFDTTESIVYRRKVRKTPASTNKAPKKRVSFHEDILKNTRTDNIHIEHGFITYKNGRKMPVTNNVGGRYSWCSEGQQKNNPNDHPRHAELCGAETSPNDDEDNSANAGNGGPNSRRRRVVYRNACSDVLDYGNSDVYDTNEPNYLQYDHSGIFEYLPRQAAAGGSESENNSDNQNNGASSEAGNEFYRCSCSSSNSSLDSDENDKNSNRPKNATTYGSGQGKSSSCDCVLGNMSNSANNNLIGESCYFSEPNIDNLNDGAVFKKSVWNKEKKPKSSCLKKTKYQTNVIQEQDLTSKVKKFNVHDMNQLLDNSSKMLIGSLKSIFTMPLPERGVPEGSEDLQSVVECLSELEQTPEHKSKICNGPTYTMEKPNSPTSPVLKAKPFLSKSLDGTKAQQGAKKFVHNVDEQLRRNKNEEIFAASRENNDEYKSAEGTKATLQRQMEFDATNDTQPSLNGLTSPPSNTQFRNKFIINCESTVFEHTGVSYEANQQRAFTELQQQKEIVRKNMVGDEDEGDEADALAVAAAVDDISLDSGINSFPSQDSTPVALPEPDKLHKAFYSAPIAKTFSNFFRSFKEATVSTSNVEVQQKAKEEIKYKEKNKRKMESYCAPNWPLKATQSNASNLEAKNRSSEKRSHVITTATTISSSSTISSDISSSSSNTRAQKEKQALQTQQQKLGTSLAASNSLVLTQDLKGNMEKQSRHIPSPLKKRNSGSNVQMQPPRYGLTNAGAYNQNSSSSTIEQNILSPDLSTTTTSYNALRGGCGRDSKSTILSDDFDDILTITTDADKNESDIVIVDFSDELNDIGGARASGTVPAYDYGNLLKPPAAAASKTSLINRFLRNVTQKKILETSMRRNNFFATKLKNEQKLLAGQLYVRGVRGPKNYELIDDLNAEIAMEIEMSGANSPRRELTSISNSSDMPGDAARFELGIGEISIDIFNGNYLHILRDPSEQLMKVFKLYTGYSREGYMTPVLVFLTDKTLYVTDLVRNCLCTKFVLTYKDLDVILLGPYGNTVLLSNSSRDMQQVLLAGGPYPADGLVANLELCARRSGSTLPAVGQLTLEHLAPLRSFVCDNSCVGKNDTWMYYAVVNVPAASLGGTAMGNGEKEPLGPNVKGFLMHRRVKDSGANSAAFAKCSWNPGYFLLKAGVLYMFNDSMQKLPSWAMALAECQGARRAAKAGRPHCFEIMLRGGELLQMAAPDEYVASEWLQALLQSASGLFEMQEKHKTLGCTLVVTQNHLITLREDFTAPLRKINKLNCTNSNAGNGITSKQQITATSSMISGDTGSVLSSAKSTPTKMTQISSSSVNSTPTKLSQLSHSSSANTSSSQTLTSQTASNSNANLSTNAPSSSKKSSSDSKEESYSNMSSAYGKNSGLEILTCADIKEMTGIKIPSHNDTWWCILEFSCQEVRESSDDLVIFFASSAEMQRFLRLLEQLWQAKNNDLFPITVLDEEDLIAEQCSMLYMDINRSWEPLLSAALGYPL